MSGLLMTKCIYKDKDSVYWLEDNSKVTKKFPVCAEHLLNMKCMRCKKYLRKNGQPIRESYLLDGYVDCEKCAIVIMKAKIERAKRESK